MLMIAAKDNDTRRGMQTEQIPFKLFPTCILNVRDENVTFVRLPVELIPGASRPLHSSRHADERPWKLVEYIDT